VIGALSWKLAGFDNLREGLSVANRTVCGEISGHAGRLDSWVSSGGLVTITCNDKKVIEVSLKKKITQSYVRESIESLAEARAGTFVIWCSEGEHPKLHVTQSDANGWVQTVELTHQPTSQPVMVTMTGRGRTFIEALFSAFDLEKISYVYSN